MIEVIFSKYTSGTLSTKTFKYILSLFFSGDAKMAELGLTDEIVERLRNVDRELHLIMEELEVKENKKTLSLSELNEIMERDRILDIDSTELIRGMRDREYA